MKWRMEKQNLSCTRMAAVILVFCITSILKAQEGGSSKFLLSSDSASRISKPEILTSGYFDVLNNGQLNAAARFIRIYIGEPGKLAIPLSVYSCVSSNNFMPNNPSSNIHLVNNLINPLSGLANISVDEMFRHHRNTKISSYAFLFQAGERILTGYRSGPVSDPLAGSPMNFLNSYGAAGFYFQTAAWERNDIKNVGVFWLSLRYIACYSAPGQLNLMMPGIRTNGWYHGFSIGWGVDISKLVNIKVIYYKYVKAPEMDYGLPIYQFSFHYALR